MWNVEAFSERERPSKHRHIGRTIRFPVTLICVVR